MESRWPGALKIGFLIAARFRGRSLRLRGGLIGVPPRCELFHCKSGMRLSKRTPVFFVNGPSSLSLDAGNVQISQISMQKKHEQRKFNTKLFLHTIFHW
jgi:hypothetical protein